MLHWLYIVRVPSREPRSSLNVQIQIHNRPSIQETRFFSKQQTTIMPRSRQPSPDRASRRPSYHSRPERERPVDRDPYVPSYRSGRSRASSKASTIRSTAYAEANRPSHRSEARAPSHRQEAHISSHRSESRPPSHRAGPTALGDRRDSATRDNHASYGRALVRYHPQPEQAREAARPSSLSRSQSHGRHHQAVSRTPSHASRQPPAYASDSRSGRAPGDTYQTEIHYSSFTYTSDSTRYTSQTYVRRDTLTLNSRPSESQSRDHSGTRTRRGTRDERYIEDVDGARWQER